MKAAAFKALAVLALMSGGMTSPVLANPYNSEEHHRQWNPQHQGHDGHAHQGSNAGKPSVSTSAPKLTDRPGTTFAYNVKDGSWWVKYDTHLAGGDARTTCDQDSKKRYGNFWCNHETKKGTGAMVVAMGFDTKEGRYRITHNTDRSGSPDTVLQACQAKGYADCRIAYDGQ